MTQAEIFLGGSVADTSLETFDRKLLLTVISDLVWKLYAQHENDVIIKLKKWGIGITVRVKHIRPLLVKWFGEP
jgi:hypothetical protein